MASRHELSEGYCCAADIVDVPCRARPAGALVAILEVGHGPVLVVLPACDDHSSLLSLWAQAESEAEGFWIDADALADPACLPSLGAAAGLDVLVHSSALVTTDP